MVSSLRLLPPGVPLLPEDEYVPVVEASAHVDLDLVLLGNELWSRARQQYEEARRLQRRITCLVRALQRTLPEAWHACDEARGASRAARQKIVRIEHAGHLIYREHF